MIDASDAAARVGIRAGITAAEARALHGRLVCFDDDPFADRRALEALGRWLTRFTPVVSCEWADLNDADPPAALWLDLTGCERLFGSIKQIASAIVHALHRFNMPHGIAVAPTVGSAWALACTGRSSTSLRIVKAEELIATVRPLSIAALRLADDVLRRLMDVGLTTIGEVLALPREALPARFGPVLLKRLDQLTGELPEPLTALVYDPPVAALHRFDAPIESPEEIGLVLQQLLDKVLPDLVRRGHGVRTLRLRLTPDRGWGRPLVVRDISLSRPHRHRKTLIELIRREIERIDCGHGFVLFQLDVTVHEPITETQSDFCEGESTAEAMEFELLLQRLRGRLGHEAVIRTQFVESYVPERAWRPAIDGQSVTEVVSQTLPRPLSLFAMPAEIGVICEPSDNRTGQPRQFTWRGDVHRLAQIVGPERIGCEWWRGHRHTRDYFDVEDDVGLRFWIFRVLSVQSPDMITARWFLHGRFS